MYCDSTEVKSHLHMVPLERNLLFILIGVHKWNLNKLGRLSVTNMASRKISRFWGPSSV